MKFISLITKILVCLFLFVQFSYADNDDEYADVLLDVYYSGVNPDFNNYYGGVAGGSSNPFEISPNVVLGNNNNFLCLPTGSYVVVGFLNNTIINAPNQDDIFIRESGAAGESAEVYVSSDNNNFTLLGIARDDSTTSFDLDEIGVDTPIVAIKIIGLDNKGKSPGFDVVSIKALTGSVGEKPCKYSLVIHKNGTGNGTISSLPLGIECGNDCNEIYVKGTNINLTATPNDNSYLSGWTFIDFKGKMDINDNQCNLKLNKNISVFVTFHSSVKCDINNDSKIGLEESIYTLKEISNIQKTQKLKQKVKIE